MAKTKKIDELEEKQKLYRSSLYKQLKAFVKDESYFQLYDAYSFQDSSYLLRLFVYNPPKTLKKNHGIIIPNPSMVEGSEPFVDSSTVIEHEPLPIAKVIKPGLRIANSVGEPLEDHYEAGDIVTLYPHKVVGTIDNPRYEHWLRAIQGAGMEVITKPPPALVSNLEENYGQYRWTRLGRMFPDDQDMHTFKLGSYEVTGAFDIDKYTNT